MYWIGYLFCYVFCVILSKGNNNKNKYVVMFFLSASSWVGFGICTFIWLLKISEKLVNDLETD